MDSLAESDRDTPDEQTQLVLEQSPHDAKEEGGEHLAVSCDPLWPQVIRRVRVGVQD